MVCSVDASCAESRSGLEGFVVKIAPSALSRVHVDVIFILFVCDFCWTTRENEPAQMQE